MNFLPDGDKALLIVNTQAETKCGRPSDRTAEHVEVFAANPQMSAARFVERSDQSLLEILVRVNAFEPHEKLIQMLAVGHLVTSRLRYRQTEPSWLRKAARVFPRSYFAASRVRGR
jgi:hypothetical protein